MTGREASIFACLTDSVVAPIPPLPPVSGTDAVAAFERYLAACPRAGSLGLRGTLLMLELGPRALGFGGRMRTLAPDRRRAYLERLSRGRLEPLVKAVQGLAHLFYYGDDAVMALIGYDAQARVQRGRALRAAEGRW
jgi:hypothetical protein